MPRLFGILENGVRNGKFEPGKGAPEYGYLTPGYDITKLLEDMDKLRKVLKDLRRAELIAAIEHDRVRAAARDGTNVQAQPTSDTHGRRQSGADRPRHESGQAVGTGMYDRPADDMSQQEALVEEDVQQAGQNLQAGRETAASVLEQALDVIQD
jgi:hypothetical protein